MQDCEHRALIGPRATATIVEKAMPTSEERDANAFAKTVCSVLNGHDLVPGMDGRVFVRSMKAIIGCLDVPEIVWKKLKAPELKGFLIANKAAIAHTFGVQFVTGTK